MCRHSTTAYGCLHTSNHSFHICTNREWLDQHQRAHPSYKYMKQRCRRDSQRGAKVLYLRMDTNCEKCEAEGKLPPREAQVVDIEVNGVFVQVLRGRMEPVGMERPKGLRVERREGGGSNEAVVGSKA